MVSPADGRVIVIKDIYEPTYLKQDVKQISIFLSVFNVHVNRAPVGGTVEQVQIQPGQIPCCVRGQGVAGQRTDGNGHRRRESKRCS